MSDTFVITLPSGASFTAQRGENLLAAAQRAQWIVPYGCRNGNCMACEAQLLGGSVLLRGEQIDATQAAPKMLLCQSEALSDLTIELDIDPVPGNLAQSRRFYTQLATQTSVGNCLQLELSLPAGRKPPILAGQYAIIETEIGNLRCEIDSQLSTARRLVLTAIVDTRLVIGHYFYVRYPLGSGIES
jgi:CDP-4-dehydro-6-deoxyglucose reductase